MLCDDGSTIPVYLEVMIIDRNAYDKPLKLKQEFIRNEHDVDEDDYYVYDAIRQVFEWTEV